MKTMTTEEIIDLLDVTANRIADERNEYRRLLVKARALLDAVYYDTIVDVSVLFSNDEFGGDAGWIKARDALLDDISECIK